MNPRPPMRAHNIRFPDPLWSAAEKKAAEQGDHISEILRNALEKYANSPEWFHTTNWQTGERQADIEAETGLGKTFNSGEALLESLTNEP